MSEEEQLIKVFYTCFQQLDWKGMLDCYHNDIFFYDPIFENLEGPQVRAMWEMLLRNAKDLSLTFSNIELESASAAEAAALSVSSPSTASADLPESYGSCNWVASYTFSQTGRRIVNKGKASFKFMNGKIIEHQDEWDFWKWIRQALGIPGILFGWTPGVQNKVRRQAQKNLEKFMARSST